MRQSRPQPRRRVGPVDCTASHPQSQAAFDLDECGGHFDDTRGYHYHVSPAGGNQIIKAFRGTPGTMTVNP